MSSQKGFSWIELLVVLAIMGVIASIAIPRLHEAEMSGNESAALSSVRTIVTAQVAFNITSGTGNYSPNLSTLASATLIDAVLGTGSKEGYVYTCTGSADLFNVTAAPQIPGQTGRRYFYADQSGVIRYSSDGPATASSPALGGGIVGPDGSKAPVIEGGAGSMVADAGNVNPGTGNGNGNSGNGNGNSGNGNGNSGNGNGNSGNGNGNSNPGTGNGNGNSGNGNSGNGNPGKGNGIF